MEQEKLNLVSPITIHLLNAHSSPLKAFNRLAAKPADAAPGFRACARQC